MIFVECKPDEILVKKLISSKKKQIIHAGNVSEVCKRLQKTKNSIGLIDEDPGKIWPPYKEQLLRNAKIEEKCGIKVVYDKERNNYLILLCPRLEEWICKVVKDAKISLNKFGLPDDPEKLHETINANLDKFEKLLNDILLKNIPSIVGLKKILDKILRTLNKNATSLKD